MNDTVEDLFARRYNELATNVDSADYFEVINRAAILRQLLVDENPLIHQVNRRIRLKIEFKVDNTFHIKLPLSSAILYTSTELGGLVLRHSENLKILTLNNFLGLKILEIEGSLFSVKDIVKFAANKLGGIHFGNVNKAEEINLKKSLDKLEKLKAQALAITINTISHIVLIALRPLKNELLNLPPRNLFFAHYTLENKGSILFPGRGWLGTEKMNENIGNGFGWFAELRVSHQKYKGIRYIYSIGSQKIKGFNFSIFITENVELGCKVWLNSSTYIKVISEVFPKSNLFNTFFNCSVVLKILETSSVLELYFNNNLIISETKNHKSVSRLVEKQVIGGDINGRRNALFEIKELILIKDGLADDNIVLVNKYFERNYR